MLDDAGNAIEDGGVDQVIGTVVWKHGGNVYKRVMGCLLQKINIEKATEMLTDQYHQIPQNFDESKYTYWQVVAGGDRPFWYDTHDDSTDYHGYIKQNSVWVFQKKFLDATPNSLRGQYTFGTWWRYIYKADDRVKWKLLRVGSERMMNRGVNRMQAQIPSPWLGTR